MAEHMLTAKLLSRNEITMLAQLFETSFDYHLNHQSAFFTDYLRSLRTLAGLGFTAVLADRDLLSVYQIYLRQFMAQKEEDFSKSPNKTLIAQSAAEMVATSIISFRALNFPRYYETFNQALKSTAANIPRLLCRASEAESLFTRLNV